MKPFLNSGISFRFLAAHLSSARVLLSAGGRGEAGASGNGSQAPRRLGRGGEACEMKNLLLRPLGFIVFVGLWLWWS